MICNKCKKSVPDYKSICPHCNNLLVNTNAIKKKTKNRYIQNNDVNLAGGVVSDNKKSIVKLEKTSKFKEIDRRKYVNYIDYQEAKEKKIIEEYRKQNNISEKDVSSKTSDLKKVRRSPKVDKAFVKNILSPDVSEIGGTVTKTATSKAGNHKVNKPVITVPVEEYYEEPPKFFEFKSSKKNKISVFNLISYVSIIAVWVIAIYFIIVATDTGYYFGINENDIVKNTNGNVDEELYGYEAVSKSGQEGNKSGTGVTSIIYDRQYLSQFRISNKDDVYSLIHIDSIKQKENCPTNIVAIENEIVNKYGITAVNLCEIDEQFARELKSVISYIYSTYPTARNYLTNITLANVDSSFIAAFMPVFTFATSNTSNGYPVATKTQILLNAKYFLNPEKIENSVSYGSKSGYFPPNATRSSSVAHEFGHYLSYVALLNYYSTNQLNYVTANLSATLYDVYDDFNSGNFSRILLEEAYGEYIKIYGNRLSFYDFRASISKYAVAKDTSGAYIYDETIAEAFHDCYLNGDNAQVSSKIILQVLLSKL